jgi:hypothetical protein
MKKSLLVGIISLIILSALAPMSVGFDVNTSYINEIDSEDKNSVSGDLLWDNGQPDEVNAIPCVYNSSFPLEQEVIDNFNNSIQRWSFTGARFRIIIESVFDPWGVDPMDIIENVKVIIYNSSEPGVPNISQFIEKYVDYFVAYYTGNYYFGKLDIAVDVEFDPGIYLRPDYYWICFQPEMEDNSFWLTSSTKEYSIFLYDSLQYPKWTSGYSVYEDYYDVSFELYGSLCFCIPRIICNGFLNWQNVKPGDNLYGTFEVCNCGEEDSLLEWELLSHPNWSDWNIYPDKGFVRAGDCVTINVEVIAPEKQNSIYTGKIKLQANGFPGSNEVDVVLTTQRSREIFNFIFLRFIDMFPILKEVILRILR